MLRQTLNHIGVVIASKVMPLASLLVYSRFLEPAEYGVVSVFFAYIWILGIALTLNLHVGIGRFIYDKQYTLNDLIGTTLLSNGVLFGIGLSIVLVASAPIASLLNLSESLLPLLVLVTIGQIVESLLVQILTAQQKSGKLFAIMAIRSLSSLATTIVLLSFMSYDKYLAIIYAEAIFSLLLLGYLVTMLRQYWPWRFSWPVLRAYCNYCIPLIPYMLSLTLLSQFDRVMIDHFVGKEAAGLYSVGYNLGILLVMVSGALLAALNPRFFNDMDNKNHDAACQDGFAVFVVCAFCAFALALFGPSVAALVIPAKYADGFALIPLVALGGLVSVVFQVWGRVIGYAKQTYLLSMVAVAATILKIGLNLLMIPMFGAWGGVATTLLAYTFMAVAVVILVTRRADQPHVYAMREIFWLGALAAVVALEFYVDMRGYGAWIAKIAILALVIRLGWQSVHGTFFLAMTARRLDATGAKST
jgi:O-antigen/teichoic acid export membrane protein